MKSKSSIIGHMACFVAYAIFGVNIVTTKDLTASHLVSPLALFTVRSVCAGALFWLISFFMPGERVAKEDYLKIFAASILGFMPDVISCGRCGEKNGEFFFDIMEGGIECKKCRREAEMRRELPESPHETRVICILSEGAKMALGYAIYSPLDKLFSFKISDEDMYLFSRASEEYLLNQVGHTYKTLEFYKKLI